MWPSPCQRVPISRRHLRVGADAWKQEVHHFSPRAPSQSLPFLAVRQPDQFKFDGLKHRPPAVWNVGAQHRWRCASSADSPQRGSCRVGWNSGSITPAWRRSLVRGCLPLSRVRRVGCDCMTQLPVERGHGAVTVEGVTFPLACARAHDARVHAHVASFFFEQPESLFEEL